MILATTLATFLTTALLVVTNAENPWFCQSYDCPGFTTQTVGGHEIRNYVQTKWVATSVTTPDQDLSRDDRRSMFRKLFKYISGENANNQEIPMTVPVLTKIETIGSQYKFTMMFYLALANPPAPNNAGSVFLVTRPAGAVFVKSFPSRRWPSMDKYRSELQNMKNEIGNAALYNDNAYYKAGYNAPFDFFKRKQHEVWVDSV